MLTRTVRAGSLAALLLLPAAPAAAQSLIWVRQFGGAQSDLAAGVAVDGKGNSYVVGWTEGALPGQTSSGGTDAWVRKYNPAGTAIWTQQFGAGSFTAALGVAVDAQGQVYVAGVTDNTLPGQTNGGGFLEDAFIRKYDSGGNILWTRQFGTADGDGGNGVAVDAKGNCYVTGNTLGAFPGYSNAGQHDAFVSAFDPAGSALWTTQFGSAQMDITNGIATDAAGVTSVVGYTYGSLPGQTLIGAPDAFVMTFDSAGAKIWTSQFGTPAIDSAVGVAVDPGGTTYVTGYTDGKLPFQGSTGGRDAFVRAYDPAGQVLWVRQFGTTGTDVAAAVAVDANGNLHVAGYTDGVFPGQTPGGGIDAFLRRFDHFGQALSLRQFGGPANDYGIGVGVDFNGFAYVAGTTDGALPGQKPAGQRDAFLAKIGGRSPAPEARIGQACHALDAFMANVLAQSGNRIAEDRAAALIAAANQAKATLDCR